MKREIKRSWLARLFHRQPPALQELFPGSGECLRLCAALWPDEWDEVRQMPMGRMVRLWLNEKTGFDIPGDAPGHFMHWVPRLREIAAERGRA